MLSKYYTSLPDCINERVNILLIDLQALSGNIIHRGARMGTSFQYWMAMQTLAKPLLFIKKQRHVESSLTRATSTCSCHKNRRDNEHVMYLPTWRAWWLIFSHLKVILAFLFPTSGNKQCFKEARASMSSTMDRALNSPPHEVSQRKRVFCFAF